LGGDAGVGLGVEVSWGARLSSAGLGVPAVAGSRRGVGVGASCFDWGVEVGLGGGVAGSPRGVGVGAVAGFLSSLGVFARVGVAEACGAFSPGGKLAVGFAVGLPIGWFCWDPK
jgi:hypothetical protein